MCGHKRRMNTSGHKSAGAKGVKSLNRKVSDSTRTLTSKVKKQAGHAMVAGGHHGAFPHL